eukprot:jgi/Psemu1/64406/estExt_Genemark1.C_640009
MPTKEAVVLILDANESMLASVSVSTGSEQGNAVASSSSSSSSSSHAKKTRFDCAKEASIAILSDLMVRSKTNEATVVVLHTETTKNHFFHDDDDGGIEEESNSDGDEEEDSVYCPFPNITEFSGNGEVMGIRQPLPDLLRKINALQPNPGSKLGRNSDSDSGRQRRKWKWKRPRPTGGGDFESGLVYAADALYRRTSGKQFDRRIILLTDAEHKVGSTYDGHQKLLVALEGLRAMDCRIQVVGMDFEKGADFDVPLFGPSEIKSEPMDGNGADNTIGDDGEDFNTEEDDSDGESRGDTDDNGGYDDDDDDDDDMLEIKQENEEYLIRLAHTTGGFVYASKELQGMLAKVMGSRVVQNPSQRKVIVEIAPGLVLEDARYYKLISKTASTPLTKKLAMVDDNQEPRTNVLGVEMLQDYEATVTHWNAEDENEELLHDRVSHAYRFGSDLLPFTPLDQAGLTQCSPVKLSVLGYMPEESVPQYLRVDAPYVLSGNESRRCCAAISALARALQRTKQVAIATFVKGVDKDPILCGLFPLLEKFNDNNDNDNDNDNGDDSTFLNQQQQPLRLIIVQLPFAGDVRYPRLEFPAENNNNDNDTRAAPAAASCCDDLIDALMLPDDALNYQQIPDHRVRSFYKTVVKRVLDRNCDVVPTRIDPDTGIDAMDTPPEIRIKAEPAVAAFYERFHFTKKSGNS